MEAPLISIITPVFNAEKIILQCMQNVQAQDFRNFEHIILDGGSVDGTIGIVKDFLNGHSNIRFISEKDNGIYDAMNKGIDMANGQWIYFLGADDYFLEKDILTNAARYLTDSTADIVYGDVWNEKEQRYYDGAFDVEKILRHNVCHQSIFYRRNLFAEVGKYELRYKIEADYVFNLQCWLRGNIAHQYIPFNIANYTAGGTSSAANDPLLKADYPALVIRHLLQGSWSKTERRHHLSTAMRKIFMRYGLKRILNEVKNAGNRSIMYTALFQMLLTFPAALLKRRSGR